MAKEMLINVSEGEECRIALVEDGKLEELYVERTSSTSHVGNIYKGRVTNVEPSIQAAFVDFGLQRNGFLHISDLMPTYFGRRGEEVHEAVGRKLARRDRPPIQRCLRRGDDIVVQIIKEGIGTKGPTLSTYLSIPGRILVMMPGMSKHGVSRKIEDEEERRRLRQILDALKPPKDSGFILRTAGIGKTKTEIQRDLNYLTRLWQNIEKLHTTQPAPIELYTEGDLVTRTVRDVFTADIGRIIVDNKDVAHRISEFFKIAMPRTRNEVELHEDAVPLFHRYGIEQEIEKMYSRHVPLPSGGSLVIDSTEAVVAIDVNSGKFRDHSDAETTAFKTDMEAADEIPRQLRLRDLGGVIICDFIDLRFERHRRDLEKRLHDNLKNDRAKTKMLRMSQFGIIEMTRQRMRPSLKRSIYFDCPHCKGAGLVKTPESMGLDVMRRLAIAASDQRVQRLELSVCPEVCGVLQNRKRQQVAAMENDCQKQITIRADASLGMDEMKLELFDARDGLVFIESLGMAPAQVLATHPGRERGAQRGGRGDNRRRDDRSRPPSRPERAFESEMEDFEGDDSEQMDRAEDAVEEREEDLRQPAEGMSPAPSGPRPIRQEQFQKPQAQPPARPVQPARAPQPPRAPQAGRPAQPARLPQQAQGARPPRPIGQPGPLGPRPPMGHPVPQPLAEMQPAGEGGQHGEGGEQGEGGHRRRRRRRRRRGRGGSGQQGGIPAQVGAGTPTAGEFNIESESDRAGQWLAPTDERPEHEFEDRPEVQPEPEPMAEPFPPVIEPESAPAMAPMPTPQSAPEPAEEKPARPRRSGRGRGRKPQPEQAPAEAAEPQVEAPAPEKTVQAADKPAKPKRPRRGGGSGGGSTSGATRRGGKKKAAAAPAAEAAPAEPKVRVASPDSVARVGSADRHLVQDEPVYSPPPSRPRTYRDLDHIPDDMD